MKPFTMIAVVVFALVALLHLLRLVLGWQITLNAVVIPIWASAVGLVIAAVLAVMLYRESHSYPD